MKTGRNDPCPCGSGKKYKKCCINKMPFEDINTDLLDLRIKDVFKSKLKKYNPEELIKYFQAVSLHPYNQKFQPRFEAILSMILEIKESEFEGNSVGQRELKVLSKNFGKMFQDDLFFIDEVDRFPQNDLIPYFIDKKEYYFFYGFMDRPYEYLKNLEEVFYPLSELFIENSEVDPKELIIEVLSVQTKILKNILEAIPPVNDYISDEEFFIPDSGFIEKISNLLYLNDQYKYFKRFSVDLGNFKNDNSDVFTAFIDMENPILSINLEKTSFIIMPQIHIEMLLAIFNNLLNSYESQYDNINSILKENILQKLQDECNSFFGSSNRIQKVEIFKDEVLKRQVNDIIFNFDNNKFLLFKGCSKSMGKNLQEVIDIESDKIVELNNLLEKSDYIKIYHSDGTVSSLDVENTDFLFFVTVELRKMYGLTGIKDKNDLENLLIMQYIDLKAMFEISKNPTTFLSFIRDYIEDDKSGTITTGIINNFASYIQSVENSNQTGKPVVRRMFDPYEWHFYYHEYLSSK